ncbi:MAG: hypothetical protein SPK76_08080 [Bacteroidales bacterium]|nr:hypothetical protein [Bacteroidales bacterium]MDY6444964.1 hypothetical protein [Bacteroidales bacterium]
MNRLHNQIDPDLRQSALVVTPEPARGGSAAVVHDFHRCLKQISGLLDCLQLFGGQLALLDVAAGVGVFPL